MLRSSAVLLTGSAVGAGVSGSIADKATAADVSLDVQGDEATVRQGNLAGVQLTADVSWSYSVPSDESPKRLVVALLAGTDAEDMTEVASNESQQLFLEASEDESFSVDLLDEGVLSGDAIVPGEGGATAETTVHLAVEMRLYDDADLVLAADSQATTATLSLTKSDYNPQEYGSVSGSGELTVELE